VDNAEMTDALYNTHILRLAASIPHQRRLATPEITVTKVSPICGSKITIDLIVEDGVVREFGQEVRACALGQAAASVLGAHIVGKSAEQIVEVRNSITALLANAPNISFAAPWTALEIFRPAIAHRARHGSILLPFEAAAQALNQRG
jgi:NifU-like protein involved in Fe-S cluster formation